MDITRDNTAVLVTDPQNDFLGEQGVTWGLVGDSVRENQTVEHIEQLLKAAKGHRFEVFVSPHYFYPTDHGWKFGGTVENMMHEIHMFDRGDALSAAMTNFGYLASAVLSTDEVVAAMDQVVPAVG